MTAYVLAQLTIHDRARYDRYAARFLEVLSRFEGRLLEATRWATSPEYRAIATDREAATVATVLAVQGLRPWRAGP